MWYSRVAGLPTAGSSQTNEAHQPSTPALSVPVKVSMQKLDDGHSFMKSHLCHSQAQCNVDHHVGVQRPGMDSKKHKCGLVDPQSM